MLNALLKRTYFCIDMTIHFQSVPVTVEAAKWWAVLQATNHFKGATVLQLVAHFCMLAAGGLQNKNGIGSSTEIQGLMHLNMCHLIYIS